MEDIGFLKAKSTKESYLFFVDSSTRDLTRSPEPNKYSIRFNTPFKNVYSLEVIDASIPRTQYAIETYNNTIHYIVNGISNFITIDIGDYSDQLLIIEINSKFELADVPITIENVSTPASIRNTFVFKSPSSFSLDMNRSTMFETLGFASKGIHTSVPNVDYYTTQTVLDDFSSDSYSVYFKNNNHILQKFNSDISGYFQKFDFNIGSNQSMTITGVIQEFKLQSDSSYAYESISTSVTLSVTANENDTLSTTSVSTSGFKTLTDDQDVYITAGVQYYIRLTFSSTTIDDFIVYSSVHLINNGNEELYSAINSTPLTFAPITNIISYTSVATGGYNEFNVWSSDGPLYSSVFNTTSADDIMLCLDSQVYLSTTTETIIAPGIYSLIGERYVILRCPEIEDHMFRSRAFEKYNMGLAKFKLSVLGYGQERFDYNGLPPRSFHPIGKLDMLTFRFERPDGELYNFRGANHTITFLIKYYTPYQKEINTFSRLNPDYNPDYLEYIQNEKSDTDDSSDEEDPEYILENPIQFQIK